jgi:hypothetical protein
MLESDRALHPRHRDRATLGFDAGLEGKTQESKDGKKGERM